MKTPYFWACVSCSISPNFPLHSASQIATHGSMTRPSVAFLPVRAHPCQYPPETNHRSPGRHVIICPSEVFAIFVQPTSLQLWCSLGGEWCLCGLPAWSLKELWWACPEAEAPKAVTRKDVPGALADRQEKEKSDRHWKEGLSGPPQPTLGISWSFAGRGRQRSRYFEF